METELGRKTSLDVGPVKMTRKVTFRDENGEKATLADVHLVDSYKNLQVEDKGFSCLKCQLL